MGIVGKTSLCNALLMEARVTQVRFTFFSMLRLEIASHSILLLDLLILTTVTDYHQYIHGKQAQEAA